MYGDTNEVEFHNVREQTLFMNIPEIRLLPSPSTWPTAYWHDSCLHLLHIQKRALRRIWDVPPRVT